MKFSSKEERDALLASFEKKAIELEEAKKSERGLRPEYNCKVIFDAMSEYDTIERDPETKEITECSGDIYVFYIRQPSLDQSIQILNASRPPLGSELNSGKVAWDIMIIKEHSSPEIQTDRIKLGYLLKLVNKIDALISDQKKS